MSVAEAMGISDDLVLSVLRQHWGRWSAQLEVFATAPEDPGQLCVWLRTAGSHDTNDVLCGFAELAATDGYDDADAARVLAWAVLPAAGQLARLWRRALPDVDMHVAAALWIEVRTVPWQPPGLITGRVLRRTRAHLVSVTEPMGGGWQRVSMDQAERELGVAPSCESSARELWALLEDGNNRGVISAADRELLLDVLTASEEERTWHGAGPASLVGDKVSDRVGPWWGVSGRTVRRRTGRAICALSHAYRPSA